MKSISIVVFFVLVATSAFAGEYVRGYSRQDGTYVSPHYRSSQDNSYNNNYSTRGNSNPYSGSHGTNSPTYNDRTPSYNKKHYGDDGRINSGSSDTRYKSLYR